MSEELQAALAEIAKKLGTTTEHIWPQLVAAQRLQWIAIFAATCVLAAAAWFTWKTLKKMPANTYDEQETATWVLAAAVVLAVVTLLFAFGLVVNINQIVYPEAAAFADLVGRVKP